jgi:hypothetical protein
MQLNQQRIELATVVELVCHSRLWDYTELKRNIIQERERLNREHVERLVAVQQVSRSKYQGHTLLKEGCQEGEWSNRELLRQTENLSRMEEAFNILHQVRRVQSINHYLICSAGKSTLATGGSIV